jgi:hypothetical protein
MSPADELAKLDVLRKSAVLSQAELHAEKGKLLAAPRPLLSLPVSRLSQIW